MQLQAVQWKPLSSNGLRTDFKIWVKRVYNLWGGGSSEFVFKVRTIHQTNLHTYKTFNNIWMRLWCVMLVFWDETRPYKANQNKRNNKKGKTSKQKPKPHQRRQKKIVGELKNYMVHVPLLGETIIPLLLLFRHSVGGSQRCLLSSATVLYSAGEISWNDWNSR